MSMIHCHFKCNFIISNPVQLLLSIHTYADISIVYNTCMFIPYNKICSNNKNTFNDKEQVLHYKKILDCSSLECVSASDIEIRSWWHCTKGTGN